MSAIILQPHGDTRHQAEVSPEDFMPLSTRMHVAGELNRLWAEFVNDIHDGPTVGRGVAEKFWAYVTRH